MTNLKDTLTTIVAVALVIFEAVDAYLKANAGQDFNWLQLVLVLAGALVAYFTGKKPNGTSFGTSEAQKLNG